MVKVFITGIGSISSIGLNVQECLKSLREGKTGIGRTNFFQSKYTETLYFAEIPLSDLSLKQRLNVVNEKHFTRTTLIALSAFQEAIEDAKRNAKRNGIEGIKFYAADVGKFLKEHPEYINTISTVILDPPRAGIAPKTLQKTIDLGAENIVYISCNPSTQARDTDALRQAGYELEKLSFVDQFPHTGHIESIAKFKRKAI